VFAFFADAGNLELITPPWLKFHIATPRPIEMTEGTRIAYRIRWHFVRLRWESEIVEWDPPRRFIDVQIRGPCAMWRHTHEFAPVNGGTRVVDVVRYRLPLGPLGAVAHQLKVRRDLETIFDYRAQRIRELLEQSSSSASDTSRPAGATL
jgi:ligand-binding SRPBCC domain-containing protein